MDTGVFNTVVAESSSATGGVVAVNLSEHYRIGGGAYSGAVGGGNGDHILHALRKCKFTQRIPGVAVDMLIHEVCVGCRRRVRCSPPHWSLRRRPGGVPLEHLV